MTDQGWRGAFYRSIDGVANVVSFSEGLLSGRYYADIKVADYGDGARRLFMGSQEGLFYSDDLGESWSLCGGGLPADIRAGDLDVSSVIPDHVYIGDFDPDGCKLYKSTDGGETWERLTNIPDGEIIEELACDPINPDIVYIYVGWEGGLFKSTDGGQSWDNIENNLPRDENFYTSGLAINRLNHDNLFIYSNTHGVFQSHDGGQNWEDFNEGLRIGVHVSAALIDPIDTGRVFLATQNSVWEITRVDTMTAIDDKENILPAAFSASSYPNPFNPSATIEYSLPEEAFVTVDIYDLLGRKVENLVREDQRAGQYRVIWYAKERASGLYYYKINAERYSHTGIMTLLK